MGPRAAATHFLKMHPDAAAYQADLFGSLAATGKGHLTDAAIREVLSGRKVEISWFPDVFKPFHPNALTMHALDADGKDIASQTYYSIGGGKIVHAYNSRRGICVTSVYDPGRILTIRRLVE